MGVTVKFVSRTSKKNFTKNIGASISDACNDALTIRVSDTVEKITQRKIKSQSMFYAAIFQRVCARTPIDEDYASEKAPNGMHTADTDITRNKWVLKIGTTEIASEDLDPDLFLKVNDRASIRYIADYIITMTEGRDNLLSTHITLTNKADPKKFNLLEYGGYKDSKTIKTGPSGIKHGVANGHSIQAPYGMLRLADGEFKLHSKTGQVDVSEYKKDRPGKKPSKARLEKMKKLLAKGGKINLKDI